MFHITYYDSKPEVTRVNGSITCIMGFPSKSPKQGEEARGGNLSDYGQQG